VRFDPWPELQLVLSGLPALPEGIGLRAWLHRSEPETDARYVLPSQSGRRDGFFRPPGPR
jgi:hypothetical protein